MLAKLASGLVAAAVVGGAMLAPTPAKAWWRRPVLVVAPPVVVRPPVVVGVPVARVWVPRHRDRFGYLVPGHWR